MCIFQYVSYLYTHINNYMCIHVSYVYKYIYIYIYVCHMYVCMCVYILIYTYAHTCVICIHMYLYIYIRIMCKYVSTYMSCVYIYIHLSYVYIYMCVCASYVYIYMYTCVICIYIYIYTNKCNYACVICVYIYICVCIYIYYNIYIYRYPNLWRLIWCVLSHDCFDWPSPPSPGVNHWALGSGHWHPPRPRRTRSGLETYAVAPCSMQVLSSRLSMPRWWGLVSKKHEDRVRVWWDTYLQSIFIYLCCNYGGCLFFRP